MHSLLFLLIPFLPGKKEPSFNLVPVNDSLFVDQTEISNYNWKEYLFWTGERHGKQSEACLAAKPDSMVWIQLEGSMDAFAEYYFDHPAYHQFPVVGISYEQALRYCAWRTERVNEYLWMLDNDLDYVPDYIMADEIPMIYEFRLPTKAEWKLIAQSPLGAKDLKKLEKSDESFRTIDGVTVHGNFMVLGSGGLATAQVESYLPSELGVYNVFGNVAELIQSTDSSQAMGGSYLTELQNYYLDQVTVLEDAQPNAYTGFRCVAIKRQPKADEQEGED